MGNELTTSVLDLPPEKMELLKRTIAKGASDDELALFAHVCKRTGLDPFAKQIHAIKRRSKNERGEWVEQMSYQTGIDGYRLTASRTGEHAGTSEPVCVDCATAGCPDCQETGGHPIKATVTVKRIVKGIICEWSASALWKEYRQTKSDGTLNKFWKLMPHGQLGKCAEALALRKAFPAELSGVYTHEEMGQADNQPAAPVALPRATPYVAPKPALPAPEIRDTPPYSNKQTAPDPVSQIERHFTQQPETVPTVVVDVPQDAPPSPGKATASASDAPNVSEDVPQAPAHVQPVPQKQKPLVPIVEKGAGKRVVDWTPEVRKAKGLISEKQFKRMWALYNKSYIPRFEDPATAEAEFKAVLESFGIQHSDEVPRKKYDDVCEFLSPGSNAKREG